MKLIRVQSENGSLNFNGFLNDNLILEPNAKIGLQSISWEKAKVEINIESNNNDFIFNIEDLNNVEYTVTARMTTGITHTTIETFIDDLEESLNKALTVDIPKHIGFQIFINERSSKPEHLTIDSTQTALIDFFVPTGDDDDNYENIGVSDAGNNIYEKTAVSASYDAALYGYNDSYFYRTGEGCGQFRLKVGELANTGKAYYIGLSDIEPVNLGGNFNFSVAKLAFGIEIKNSASAIDYIFRDETTGIKSKVTSAIIPSTPAGIDITNDVIELTMNKGKIEGRVYQHDGATYVSTLLFSHSYNKSLERLYPIVGFHDKTGNSIQNLRYTPTISVESVKLNDPSLAGIPPQDNNEATFTLTLPDDNIRQFLGFDKLILIDGPSSIFKFNSENPVSDFDEAENYLVLLDSLNLDSYDYSAGKSKRRNLLQLIPNIRNKGQKDVLYFTDHPIMIDLKNASKISLNNIIMRVLDSNEAKVNISGFSECVLIVDDQKK